MDKERLTYLNWGSEASDKRYNATSSQTLNPPPDRDDIVRQQWELGQAGASSMSLLVPTLYQNKVGWERISGTTGSRQTFNPVLHTKIQGVNNAYLFYQQKYNDRKTWYHGPYYRHPFPSSLVDISPQALLAKHQSRPVELAVRARAWHSMQPRFESDVKLLNTLFELKDFKYAATQLLKSGLKRSLLEDASDFVNKLWRDRRIDLSRPLAGSWLAYQLAVLPTIKDATAILSEINSIVLEKQRQFSEDGEYIQTSHFSEPLGIEETGSTGTGNYYWRSLGTYSETKFTATYQYTYKYKMRDTIDAWRKYWGLNSSFEAFWNMIPFSFVADYFVGIGKSIRAMERDPNVVAETFCYGESVKTTFSTGYYINSDTRDMVTCFHGDVRRGDSNHGLLLTGYQGTHYHRYKTAPYYGPALPKIKVPKTKQLLTMAALARCILS